MNDESSADEPSLFEKLRPPVYIAAPLRIFAVLFILLLSPFGLFKTSAMHLSPTNWDLAWSRSTIGPCCS